MLLLMINFALNFAPQWMFKPMNENLQFSDIKPTVSNCRMIPDTTVTKWSTPSTWIKNDKYTCGEK